MSTSHHSDEEPSEAMKRLFQQAQGKAPREYPRGRLGSQDEGSLAFAIGVDEKSGTIILNFNKPVSWMGMTPEDAMAMAAMLISKARAISKVPLTLQVP